MRNELCIAKCQGKSNEIQLRRSVSNRCVYINEEIPKRTQKNSAQTIFHSPYKNGVKNKDYSNPSFMSSDVVYHIDYNHFNRTPKKAIIHTEAELKQKALYNQRMNKSTSYKNFNERIRENLYSIKKKTRQRQIQQKINLRNQPQPIKMSATLKNQFENLMKYKRQREIKQSQRNNQERFFRKTPTKKQLPIYLQKVYSNPNYEVQCEQKKREELRQWLGINQELNLIRKQIQKQKHKKQTKHIHKNVENYQRLCHQKQSHYRNNQLLLAKILKEQMRAKQKQKLYEKKQKGWRAL